MRRPGRIKLIQPPNAEREALPSALRDRLAMLVAVATLVCLVLVFLFAKGTQFLMPGPLASAHGTIENCNACHTESGTGKLSWLHGLVAGDPHADSKACLTCHKMPDTAFKAHGASAAVLEQSTARLTKVAAATPVPQSARAQSVAFPMHDALGRDLNCATCHQEHQGVNFKLNKISNEQCRSCHVVKFDSFDGHHPPFENYPFKRRTRIIYDHAGHFGKHFPEMAKKNPTIQIPATCSTCHDSRKDKRVMAVAPFEKTCTSCHLDQIIGKERVSGPKGIAFLSLPGLDLQTLKKKKAAIGEWPDGSEAALTPFMKVMISRNKRGRDLIKVVDGLNLQDLTRASDNQIKAVTNLAWEIKGLFYALIRGKASDVLGDLNIAGGAKLSANLVADLTASIPRDVVISAQQQWLPSLGTEMANRANAGNRGESSWSATITESKLVGSVSPKPEVAVGQADTANVEPGGAKETRSAERASPSPAQSRSDGSDPAEKQPGSDTPQVTPDIESPRKAAPDPQACIVSVFGQCLVSKGPENGAQPAKLGGPARQSDRAKPASNSGRQKSSAEELPAAMQAELKQAGQAGQPEATAEKTNPPNAKPDTSEETLSAIKLAQAKAADQSDDLLFPTEGELRAMKAGKSAGQAAQPERGAGKPDTANARADGAASADASSNARANAPPDASTGSDTARAGLQTGVAPVISIQSDVDPESWAEYGGWYRQDYAISYRPAGHKDKFTYSWLFLTGPQAPKGTKSPPAAVFDSLTGNDAQGSCTKCHSVDDIRGKGRVVNFSPPSAESKQGRFTNFIHEPHLSILESRGCLTCHNLEKGRPYLKSYEQGNPLNFASNFGAVKKDLCQTCHTSSMARQDCLTCHKYHVNGVVTPIMSTKIPTE